METTTTTKRKSVCFAYFADGKFIGWYADSWGSIREDEPKVYGYTPEQVEIITKNFRYKLSTLAEESKLGEKVLGLNLIDNSVNADRKELSQYSEVELRAVECPYYDGPNPDFDEAAYEVQVEKQKEQMKAEGIFDIPGPSLERMDAVTEFHKRFPSPECNNWIYVDYKKVKEWAKNEPTEFLETIK